MSFQAYIDNIQQKTGKTPDDFHAWAMGKGLLRSDIKATEFVDCVKSDFGLGHGHCMAIVELFKRRKWIELAGKYTKKKK